jgi:probable HAF family extracellular repeat protein
VCRNVGRLILGAAFLPPLCLLLPGCPPPCADCPPPPCAELFSPVAGEVFEVDGFGTILTLGRFGDGPIWGEGINADGVVAGSGYGWCGATAFRSEQGEVVRLGTLGGSGGRALAINDAGQIVGTSETGRLIRWVPVTPGFFPEMEWRAFIWENGQTASLGELPGTIGSAAAAINSAGQIVGWAELPWDDEASGASKTRGRATTLAPPPRIPVLWEYVDGTWQITDLRPRGLGSATDVNNRGEIVGSSTEYTYYFGTQGRALLWSDGVLTELGTLGGENSAALAINDLGQVVGVADTADFRDDSEYAEPVTHAFLWQDAEMTDLGTLGGSTSIAHDINKHRQVVGTSETGEMRGEPVPWQRIEHAFIWQDGKMTDLNTLLPPESGWEFSSAAAINDAGQILADAGSPQGRLEYVVITLTPEAAQRTAAGNQP